MKKRASKKSLEIAAALGQALERRRSADDEVTRLLLELHARGTPPHTIVMTVLNALDVGSRPTRRRFLGWARQRTRRARRSAPA